MMEQSLSHRDRQHDYDDMTTTYNPETAAILVTSVTGCELFEK